MTIRHLRSTWSAAGRLDRAQRRVVTVTRHSTHARTRRVGHGIRRCAHGVGRCGLGRSPDRCRRRRAGARRAGQGEAAGRRPDSPRHRRSNAACRAWHPSLCRPRLPRARRDRSCACLPDRVAARGEPRTFPIEGDVETMRVPPGGGASSAGGGERNTVAPGTTKAPGEPRAFCGGRYQTRTDDLFRVKEARYQLRQSPASRTGLNDRTGCRTVLPTNPKDTRGAHLVLRPRPDRVMSYECSGQAPGTKCGCSAVGSAQPCQGWGREFESRHPLEWRELSSAWLADRSRHVGRTTSRWRGRAARHRPAKPFTRVRIPSPPRLTIEQPV